MPRARSASTTSYFAYTSRSRENKEFASVYIFVSKMWTALTSYENGIIVLREEGFLGAGMVKANFDVRRCYSNLIYIYTMAFLVDVLAMSGKISS
jgi:hypothetical protein